VFTVCLSERYSSQLGESLANLHLHNKRQLDQQMREQQTVGNYYKGLMMGSVLLNAEPAMTLNANIAQPDAQ